MSKKRLIFDPGHGGTDPGANGFGIREKDWNLRISLYQYNRLKDLGADVSITRTNDRTLSSAERTNMIRNGKYDLCISNHWNAFNGTARGVETIHSIQSNGALAKKLADVLVKTSKLPLRRVFSRRLNSGLDYYFMHRLTGSVETIIIEYAFIDNRTDHNWYKNDANFYKAAEAVVQVLAKELGVAYVAPGGQSTPKPTPVKEASGTLYRVQTGAFSDQNNADALQERLEEANIDTYLIQDQGLFKVQVGAYSKKQNAEAQADALKKLGFDTFITTQVGSAAHASKDERPQPKPAVTQPSQPSVSISEGSRVVLNNSATHYATGQAIPASRKGTTYTVKQTGNGRILLDEITSWVYIKDVTVSGSRPAASPSKPSGRISVGQSVTAPRLYATGQSGSPARTTPITGTVDVISSSWRNEVRLKNSSGVYIGFARLSDLGGSSSPAKPASSALKKGDRVRASRLYTRGADTSPARTTAINGYVDAISSNWRNQVRLVKTKGKNDYIGFARQEHITKL